MFDPLIYRIINETGAFIL